MKKINMKHFAMLLMLAVGQPSHMNASSTPVQETPQKLMPIEDTNYTSQDDDFFFVNNGDFTMNDLDLSHNMLKDNPEDTPAEPFYASESMIAVDPDETVIADLDNDDESFLGMNDLDLSADMQEEDMASDPFSAVESVIYANPDEMILVENIPMDASDQELLRSIIDNMMTEIEELDAIENRELNLALDNIVIDDVLFIEPEVVTAEPKVAGSEHELKHASHELIHEAHKELSNADATLAQVERQLKELEKQPAHNSAHSLTAQMHEDQIRKNLAIAATEFATAAQQIERLAESTDAVITKEFNAAQKNLEKEFNKTGDKLNQATKDAERQFKNFGNAAKRAFKF